MKNVLITGSSHGIGAAAAIAFAKEGYNVGINCNHGVDAANEVAAKCEAYGVKTKVYIADVSKHDNCKNMILDFIETFGNIDVLINNAGGALKMPEGEFKDMPMEYWDSQIALNLSAAAYCSRYAVEDMIAKGVKGKIINISSIHSKMTWVRRKVLPYCAAKAGLNMFTADLGVEVAKYGINVNCIAPGLVFTKLAERYSPEDVAAFQRSIPYGNGAVADDIVPMMLFLADHEKCKYIVGQTIVIDGGQSIDGAIESMNFKF